MIGSTRRVAVYAYTAATDMRKGHDGLSALVERALGRDPLSGEMFLFVSRDRKRSKVLVWDGTGLCLFAKRLEKGRFADLSHRGESSVRLTMNELQLFLEGSTLVGRVRLSPKEFVRKRVVGALAL